MGESEGVDKSKEADEDGMFSLVLSIRNLVEGQE